MCDTGGSCSICGMLKGDVKWISAYFEIFSTFIKGVFVGRVSNFLIVNLSGGVRGQTLCSDL